MRVLDLYNELRCLADGKFSVIFLLDYSRANGGIERLVDLGGKLEP